MGEGTLRDGEVPVGGISGAQTGVHGVGGDPVRTNRKEVRVENVAGYLITPGFIISKLHVNPIRSHVGGDSFAGVNGSRFCRLS